MIRMIGDLEQKFLESIVDFIIAEKYIQYVDIHFHFLIHYDRNITIETKSIFIQ